MYCTICNVLGDAKTTGSSFSSMRHAICISFTYSYILNERNMSIQALDEKCSYTHKTDLANQKLAVEFNYLFHY